MGLRRGLGRLSVRRMPVKGLRQQPPRADEALRTGVARGPQHMGRIPLLHTDAPLHDEQPVGKLLHHGQIMGHDDEAQTAFRLQAGKQAHDVPPVGRIKGGGRLVGDDEAGPQPQTEADQAALQRAAGKLVGVALQHAGGQVELPQYLLRQLVGLSRREGALFPPGLPPLRADGEEGIEGAPGLLENGADARAAQAAGLRRGGAQHVGPRKQGLAVRGELRRQQPQERPAEQGLAAAALAHDAQTPPFAQRKAHVRHQRFAGGPFPDAQTVQGGERRSCASVHTATVCGRYAGGTGRPAGCRPAGCRPPSPGGRQGRGAASARDAGS